MTDANLRDTDNLDGFGLDNGLSFPGDAGAAKRSNALSNKLTNVLSTSHADSEVRDALRLLDARGAYTADETRLNLKYEAQREVLEANAKIVDDFGKVAKQLQRVGALITILNQTCSDMRSHIQLAKQETFPMLEEASTLLTRKDETESKQQLLDAFNEHFLVSDEDLTVLTSTAEPVNDRYFTVLARVKHIHKDCELLLGHENQRLGLELMEQTSRDLDAGYKKLYTCIQREFKGLDLEDPRTSGSVRRSLRALSERPTLFQNCLDLFGEARETTLSDAFQTALTDSTIGSAKAIEFSTHDPLRYIGDMLAWVHSTTVSEKEALEGFFISDADDISRNLQAGKSSEPWTRLGRSSSGSSDRDSEMENDADLPQFDGQAALNSLISRDMASVSHTLQQRISLAIRNLVDPLSIYKAYNLLVFYEDIFLKLLGMAKQPLTQFRQVSQPQHRNQPFSAIGQNTLLAALSSLQSQALALFTNLLAEELESHSVSAPPNLEPPSILQTHITLLVSILHLRAPSLTRDEFANLYSTILSPVLKHCSEIADSFTATSRDEGIDGKDRANFEATLYKLNYLCPIITAFRALSAKDGNLAVFVTPPLAHADKEVLLLQTQLADLLVESFLYISGVSELLDLFEKSSSDESDADNSNNKDNKSNKSNGDHPFKDAQALNDHRHLQTLRKQLLQSHKLEELSTTLDTFLASALMDAQDDLAKLTDKAVAKGVITRGVEVFCEEMERLIGMIEAVDDAWMTKREKEDNDEDAAAAGIGEKSRGEADEEGSGQGDDDGDNDDEALLREVYPRTVAEVRALLS